MDRRVLDKHDKHHQIQPEITLIKFDKGPISYDFDIALSSFVQMKKHKYCI